MPSAPGLKSAWWTIPERTIFYSPVIVLSTVHIYLYSQFLPLSLPVHASRVLLLVLIPRTHCKKEFRVIFLFSFGSCLSGWPPCTIHFYLAIFIVRGVMACISPCEPAYSLFTSPCPFFSSLSIPVKVVFMSGYASRRLGLSFGLGLVAGSVIL